MECFEAPRWITNTPHRSCGVVRGTQVDHETLHTAAAELCEGTQVDRKHSTRRTECSSGGKHGETLPPYPDAMDEPMIVSRTLILIDPSSPHGEGGLGLLTDRRSSRHVAAHARRSLGGVIARLCRGRRHRRVDGRADLPRPGGMPAQPTHRRHRDRLDVRHRRCQRDLPRAAATARSTG